MPPATTTTASTPAVQTAAALGGNWLLAGSMPAYFVPSNGSPTNLVLSISATGENLVAGASLQGNCTAGGGFGYNLQGILVGTAASNGSFTLGFSNVASGDSLTITGTVPSASGSPWSGSYSYTNNGSSSCASNLSGNFQATPVPAISGTYQGQGSLSQFNGSLPAKPVVGTPYGLSATLQQGTGTSALTLSGSIKTTGFPCFSTGQITNAVFSGGQLYGDEISAAFVMNDGSQLDIYGVIDNAADTQLSMSFVDVQTGACAGSYIFNPASIMMSH